VQYELPPPLPWRMRQFCDIRLKETLEEVRYQLSTLETERWPLTCSYVARLCRQPRDVIRICNRLRISLPTVAGEVDACDLMLIEALHVTHPIIATAIRANPGDFAGDPGVDFEDLGFGFYYERAAALKQSERESGPRWQVHVSSSE